MSRFCFISGFGLLTTSADSQYSATLRTNKDGGSHQDLNELGILVILLQMEIECVSGHQNQTPL